MFLLFLLNAAPVCGLVDAPIDPRTVVVGDVVLQVPGVRLSGRCDGAAVVIEGDSRWPVPLRLERDERGVWHDVVPLPADASGEGWLARDEALTALARNPAVRHRSERQKLLGLRLGDFKRIGTMPGTQAMTDAYWSLDDLCVTQGTSDKVRCLNPVTRRWSAPVARARRVAAAPGRSTYDANKGVVFVDGQGTQLASVTSGAEWSTLLKTEHETCEAARPTLAEVEARECADPDSVACAQWARYGPTEEQFNRPCVEPVVSVRFSRDERFALLVVRAGPADDDGTWVLFLGKRL